MINLSSKLGQWMGYRVGIPFNTTNWKISQPPHHTPNILIDMTQPSISDHFWTLYRLHDAHIFPLQYQVPEPGFYCKFHRFPARQNLRFLAIQRLQTSCWQRCHYFTFLIMNNSSDTWYEKYITLLNFKYVAPFEFFNVVVGCFMIKLPR